ncbi:unnamed protein product [Calicophoron daubneyi]|uniref:PUM-HD domain-containing protein n=1 Tax=Calicophoron daubneyi TaxID=300641 RepID=A0AAV2TVB0_CALDB
MKTVKPLTLSSVKAKEPMKRSLKLAAEKTNSKKKTGKGEKSNVEVNPKDTGNAGGKRLKRRSGAKGRLDKRGRRKLKLQSKKHSEVVMKILPKWEIIRRDDTPKNDRFEMIEEVLRTAKGKLADLCFAHDTSRIIQSAIRYGTDAQRWQIFGELKPFLRLMSKFRFAKFVLIKMIKYGAKEYYIETLKSVRSHVARLVNNRIAIEVVDMLYNDYATAAQRVELMQELYGNVHTLRLVENDCRSLADALKLNPTKHSTILANVNKLLTSLVSKGLTKYSIVQHLLLEYLQLVSLPQTKLEGALSDQSSAAKDSSTQPEEASAMTDAMDVDEVQSPEKPISALHGLLESIAEGHVVPMLHTREGVRAALHVLWASPTRIRKTLVKGLKTCVSALGRNEHGHLFLIGLLDMIDDIQLLDKVVIKEIVEDLELFVTHPDARKVLLFALSPRDPHYFSSQMQANLFLPGDANLYTKKSLGTRALELRSTRFHLLPCLLHLAASKLKELFIGDVSHSQGDLALEDRGRVLLLMEILMRSSPHHLNVENILASYHRSLDSQKTNNQYKLSKTTPLPQNEIEELTRLRYAALENFVNLVLVPKFTPVGYQASEQTQQQQQKLSKAEQRMRRHKRVVALAEQALAAQGKPGFSPFTSGEEKDDESSEEDKPFTSLPTPVCFLERPEGQMMVRRLLLDGKSGQDFTLARLIMERVSSANLCAWTRCNRSCFTLVNLFELGDQEVCEALKKKLEPCLPELQISTLAGGKVLLKHLEGKC